MKKLGAVIALFAVVVLVMTWLTPWTASYEVKTAAKTACNEVIKQKKGYGDDKWAEVFMRKATAAGVKLKPGQFAFSAELLPNLGINRCHYKIAWKSVTPWVILSDLFDDLPPLTLIYRIDDVHEVNQSF